VFVTKVLGGGGKEQRAKNWARSVCNRPLPPPPPTLGPVGRNPGVPGWVRLKFESAEPGLSVTDLSLPHPHAGLGRPERRAPSQTDKVHYAPGSH
jgi:hypothetical protein